MNTEEYERLKKQLTEQWTTFLLARFSGLDWWQLDKKHKEIYCREMAGMIVRDIEDIGKVLAGDEYVPDRG